MHISIMNYRHDLSPAPLVSLLYLDHGTSTGTPKAKVRHHDYWQIEVILEGAVSVELDKRQRTVYQNQIIIIPPEVNHLFVYKQARKTWSIKFALKDFEGSFSPLILPDESPNCRIFSNSIIEMFKPLKQFSPELYTPLEYLLGALLRVCYSEEDQDNNVPEWFIRTRELMTTQNERYFSIEEIAEKVGYSRIHLSRLFKSYTGIPLKEYYDKERALAATRKLLYSNKSISNIAQEMGFTDIYSFSRFYKRVTGISPSKAKMKY